MQLTRENVLNRTILYGYRGSKAHGMYIPPEESHGVDDIDYMGVAIAPPECYFGLQNFEQKEINNPPEDIVIYEIRKMFRLLLKGNPNVLSLLWLEPEDYLIVTEAGQMILDSRDLFVGAHAFHAFVGYAHGQLQRMTHFKFEGYMGEKRKRLVEQHGYDCKNAAHLIRLLRMGIEFLREGRLIVKRPDAAELLRIKHGELQLEQIQNMADHLFKEAYHAFEETKLPSSPNHKEAEQLLQNIIVDCLRDWGEL